MNLAFTPPPPAIPCCTAGGLVDLAELGSLAPALAPEVLAQSLAGLNRYGGATTPSWSVAAHSVVVAHLVETPAAQAWALLHDAHEPMLGDFTRPGERLIEHLTPGAGVRAAFQTARNYLDTAVRAVWQLEHLTLAELAQVEEADRIAGNGERLVFFRDPDLGEADQPGATRAAEIMAELDMPCDRIAARRLWLRFAFSLARDGVIAWPDPALDR